MQVNQIAPIPPSGWHRFSPRVIEWIENKSSGSKFSASDIAEELNINNRTVRVIIDHLLKTGSELLVE